MRATGVFAIGVMLAFSASAQQKPPAKSARSAKASAAQGIRLTPTLVPGQALRYQMEFRTTTESRHEGLVQDPQAATQLEISWNAIVRVEILGPPKSPAAAPPATGAPGAAAPVRIRTTYERSVAAVHSDSFDPAAALMEKQYQNLQGRSIEFTLNLNGEVTDVTGLEEVVTDPQAAAAARQWVAQIVTGASIPPGGILPGQHWTSERPAESAPLAGIIWRTDSSYLRDEDCHAASPSPSGTAKPAAEAKPPAGAGVFTDEPCAVILTRLEMGQPKPLRDPTPEGFRKRGLRTGGTWRGSGESLNYISRRTGWVVSSTQSGTEEIDLTISSATEGSSMHYAGKVRSQSQITLLPEKLPEVPR
jgi:hypothetical protein